MNSDLKKHELLKTLSIQRQNSNTPLGIGFESILESLKIDREYLDFICGELYGNEEIHFFEDYQYIKGLHATKVGVSAYSSEKYVKRNTDRNWKLIKNVIAVITLIVIITAEILLYQGRIKKIETQDTHTEAQDKSPNLKQQSETKQNLKTEQYNDTDKDSTGTNLNE